MARRFKPQRRQVKPDPQYGNKQVSMFVNRMMKDGKKSVALKIMYTAFGLMEKKAGKDPVEMFLQALGNVSPTVEVKPRRVGGATYQVPIEVISSRREALAMRWLLAAARLRSGKSMAEKLAGELADAANNTGGAMKKREEVHRMAESNRAFSHYRF
ncbi:MAG: 30S ribosomal protein S7 [Anaerolineales bacterium]|jgi:small subunit ribosomal protein S7|nr:30S ribosomal protein S7 [Anaerolineales bacterium]HJL70082.1 30S ribosomal protein S7 [Anaerolineales bacterium]|tara:strand:- start:4 stop:474 length:471 start_codon:yes stop_codon:yes gene_type:complete